VAARSYPPQAAPGLDPGAPIHGQCESVPVLVQSWRSVGPPESRV